MRRILIANRGEIAVRIIKTLKKMGVYTIAIHSDIDKNLKHVLMADESYNLGEYNCYLDIDKIIEVAKKAKADGIHPGYGFLSENSLFAKACYDNNITFIGPSYDVIEKLGDKLIARYIAQEANVPIPPSKNISSESIEQIEEYCKEIGFPVMIKAAKGGGGKGIRIVYSKDELYESIQAAKREALQAFADDSIYIEKYIENPRHIEVQIFGDNYGKVIDLNLRECSIQRRHQKLIEEAPPLDEETRRKIADAAIRIAQKVNYTNAGTVEFIFKDGNFYFLEVNTRLQVEHPVTEMITNLDLVKLQYEIAFGGKVPEKVEFNGHAIECRITAEDPENNFMPLSGKILHFSYPENVRIDTFIEEGTEISPFYDSLLCKVITHGKNREEAIEKMIFALKNLTILPLKTNKNLLIDILKSEEFRKGNIHTNFIPYYFKDWKEKYDQVLDEETVLNVFNKFGYLLKEDNKKETLKKGKQQDLSMWYKL